MHSFSGRQTFEKTDYNKPFLDGSAVGSWTVNAGSVGHEKSLWNTVTFGLPQGSEWIEK